MGGLPAGGGFGGAAKRFYLHNHVLVLSVMLSLVGIGTGTATAMVLLQSPPLLEPHLFVAAALVAAGCCMLQTRHLPLAVLTAVAPLPGLIWAAPVSGGSSFGAVPFLAYAFAFAVAASEAQAVVSRALDGEESEHPWRPAAAAAGLAAAMALMWFRRTPSADAALQLVMDTALAMISAAILVPAGAYLLRFDESFVARANRVRERRQRSLEWAALAATPRWALSFSGIALIFVALGWFGAEPLKATVRAANLLAPGAVSVVLFFLIAARLTGGWREALGATLAAAVVCLIGLWAAESMPHEGPVFVGILEMVALAAFLAFVAGRRAWGLRRSGDDATMARQRAMEEMGTSQVFAAAGAFVALLPYLALHPGYAADAGAMLFAAFGGALFAPALATAAEILLPRHRTVEEIYGRR